MPRVHRHASHVRSLPSDAARRCQRAASVARRSGCWRSRRGSRRAPSRHRRARASRPWSSSSPMPLAHQQRVVRVQEQQGRLLQRRQVADRFAHDRAASVPAAPPARCCSMALARSSARSSTSLRDQFRRPARSSAPKARRSSLQQGVRLPAPLRRGPVPCRLRSPAASPSAIALAPRLLRAAAAICSRASAEQRLRRRCRCCAHFRCGGGCRPSPNEAISQRW